MHLRQVWLVHVVKKYYKPDDHTHTHTHTCTNMFKRFTCPARMWQLKSTSVRCWFTTTNPSTCHVDEDLSMYSIHIQGRNQKFAKGGGTKRSLGTEVPQWGPAAEPRWGSGSKPPEAGDIYWMHNGLLTEKISKYTTQGKLNTSSVDRHTLRTQIDIDYRLENTEPCWKQRKKSNRSQQNTVNELKWLGTGFAALYIALSYHRMQFILVQ